MNNSAPENTSFRKKMSKSLALFLPGIFLLGFNLGTGSVTAMAKAGADYGMTLLWTIVASCLCTFFMINLYGPALTLGVAGSVMGVMGIVADICFEWSKTFIEGGIAPIWFAAFFSALVFFIFWNGKTEFFERSLAVIVAIMSACFLINFFMLMPPPVDIIKGLIPSVPNVGTASGAGPLLVIASMVGTRNRTRYDLT